jgi:hypothetical protein
MRSSVHASAVILFALLAIGCGSPDGAAGPTDVAHALNANPRGSGEIFRLGDFALYMPAAPDGPRAVIVAIGSRNTKGFVTGEPFGVPFPPIEAQLAAMGGALRALADARGVAILGTSLADMPDGAVSDQRILDAIAAAAQASGHADLSSVPIVFFGLFGGAPEASGFAARYPERVAGLLLKVPLSVAILTAEAQREVPTFMVLAELEVFVDNVALGNAFTVNRGAGALWAMSVEPGVPHQAFTPAFRSATVAWLNSVLGSRLSGSAGRIHRVTEQSGWLGDPVTGEVSPWGRYLGDRTTANWFATREAADQWRVLSGIASASALAN